MLDLKNLLLNNTQKQIVGVSLTPGIGLEAAIYDKSTNTILKYGRRKVEYNFSTREIQNFVEFKAALSDLIQELDVPSKTLAYIVLPNVYFNFIEINSTMAEAEIRTAILSEAEEFYVFKDGEPVSGWCPVVNIDDPTQKKLVYSSFQRSVVDELQEIFSELHLQLIGIESAYSATIRGLHAVGMLDETIAKRESWTAMVISSSSYILMYFDADNLINFKEEPIAIKSFSTEEAYSVIASSASQVLENFASSKLYIISQTDDICAEILKHQMQFDKTIVAIDSNKYSKKPIVEITQTNNFKAANSLTLSVIGACNVKTDLGLTINAIAEEAGQGLGIYFTTSILGTTIDVTSELVIKLVIVCSVALAIFFGILILIFHQIGANAEGKAGELNGEIDNVKQLIAAEQVTEVKQEVDINQVIDEVAQINVKAIKYYDSIANDIPKDVWLTKYYNQAGDRIVIQGIAENITDIYEYFKNLKIIFPDSDIKLNGLRVVTNTDEDLIKDLYVDTEKNRLYSFEISNTAINYNPESYQTNNGEENIIIKAANGVEQLSNQVKPAE